MFYLPQFQFYFHDRKSIWGAFTELNAVGLFMEIAKEP